MRHGNHKQHVVLSVFGVMPLRIGGTERYCWELTRALHKRGWQSVLAFEGKLAPVVKDYLHLPNASIEMLPPLNTGGVETLIAFCRLIRKYRPDIVHLHYTGFVTPFPWLARLTGVRKVFLTSQHSYPEGFQAQRTSQPKRTLARLINSPVCGVVCASDFGRRCLIKTGVLPEHRFKVIYNATHLADLAAVPKLSRNFRARFRIPDDRVIITQVGQLIPEKGVHDLLAAFKLALAKDKQLQLVLVGEGPNRPEYERKIAEWGLSSRVILTGLMEDVSDAGVFEASDICCLTSRWEELFGFVLVEAMTRGKPVVATRVGGIPEIVVPGETGFLVDRGDIEGIATHLVELAQSPSLQMKMGTAGRERMANLFDVRENVLQVIQMYGIT